MRMVAHHCSENDAGVGLLMHGYNDQSRTAPVPGPTQLRANGKTSFGPGPVAPCLGAPQMVTRHTPASIPRPPRHSLVAPPCRAPLC
jgi:hypothetical protein